MRMNGSMQTPLSVPTKASTSTFVNIDLLSCYEHRLHSPLRPCTRFGNGNRGVSSGSSLAFPNRSSPLCQKNQHNVCIQKPTVKKMSGEIHVDHEEGHKWEPFVMDWREKANVGKISDFFNAAIFTSSKCWGRRPFLMRGAFDPDSLLGANPEEENEVESGDMSPGDSLWPSWEDVVHIAADEDVEARIISHRPGDISSFELEWGPIPRADVGNWISLSRPYRSTKTPTPEDYKHKKTLVVNDVDRYYPPLADWVHDMFRFLPRWRIDDAQISLAEQFGGIGPHVDNYDVFLIQMSGTRLWQIGTSEMSIKEEKERLIKNLDVRVLNDWDLGSGKCMAMDVDSDEERGEIEEWVVHPGDLLYLPPRVAHCGKALSDGCMTLSIGCRAPSAAEIISKLAERLSTSDEDFAVRRYEDYDSFITFEDSKEATMNNSSEEFSPGDLTSEAKHRSKHLVLEAVSSMLDNDKWWDEFFGKYATEQKRVRNNYPIPLDNNFSVIYMEGEGYSNGNNDDKLGSSTGAWEDAHLIVQNVLKGRGCLYHAEGIVFAYSSVPSTLRAEETVHRLFANGEMWESKNHVDMARLFHVVANHRRLDQPTLLGVITDQNIKNRRGSQSQSTLNFEMIGFLENLVTIGVLYGTEE